MVQRQTGQKVYKTMQGKKIDMDMLRKRNELTPAVGNAKVNARGDEIGPGGQIVRKREELIKDYYDNSKGVKSQPAVKRETFQPPVDAEKDLTDDWVDPDDTSEWVEDKDGNFVKKGE
jgi:hypothetical protein